MKIDDVVKAIIEGNPKLNEKFGKQVQKEPNSFISNALNRLTGQTIGVGYNGTRPFKIGGSISSSYLSRRSRAYRRASTSRRVRRR